MRRLALWTGLAALGGLVLGALLAGGPPELPGVPSLSDAPAGPTPRLAQGSVALEVTNEGRDALEVDLEVLDGKGQRVFQSSFPLGAGGTVRRNMISPPAGLYDARLTVDGVALAPEAFHTDECGGSLVLTFAVRFERGAVRARELARSCA